MTGSDQPDRPATSPAPHEQDEGYIPEGEEQPPPGTLRQVDRFTLPEVNASLAGILAEGRNPLLIDV